MSYIEILSEDKNTLVYRPEINRVIKHTESTIMLSQILHWWKISNRQPFYKFIDACKHKDYRDGDSWVENTGFTPKIIYSSFEKLVALGLIVTYYDRIDHKNWFGVNEANLEEFLTKIYEKKKEDVISKTQDKHIPKGIMGIIQNRECPSAQMVNAHYTKGEFVSIAETTTETNNRDKKIYKKENLQKSVIPKFDPVIEIQNPEYQNLTEPIRDKFLSWFTKKPGKRNLESFKLNINELMKVNLEGQNWLLDTALEKQINGHGWQGIKAEWYKPQNKMQMNFGPPKEPVKPQYKLDANARVVDLTALFSPNAFSQYHK